MKKIGFVLLLGLVFVGCAKTSDPENLAGKIDMSKPVDYVVIPEENREESIYVLTGQVVDGDQMDEDSDISEEADQDEPEQEEDGQN